MIRRRVWLWGLIGAGALAAACEDVTQVVQDSTEFKTTLAVSSTILDTTGDTLVGDTVSFSSTVTRDGVLFRTSEPFFESSDSNIVKILDATTGVASLDSVGRAVVSVTFTASEFPDSLLRAAMTVAVDSLSVSLALLSEFVVSGDTLVGDTVQFQAVVKRRDGRQVEDVVALFESNDTTVLKFVDVTTGLAFLVGSGTAEVTATFLRPLVPGTPLVATVPIKVKDFAVLLDVVSVSSGTIQEGDTLVSDTVQFSVMARLDDDTLPVANPMFVSSNPSIVTVLDPVQGRAVFADTGIAVLTVSYDDPDLPNRTRNHEVRVTTFLPFINGPASPIMGEEVEYSAIVVDTRTGQVVGTSGRKFSSSNPSVAQLLDEKDGEFLIRDIGSAEIRVTFERPKLPYSLISNAFGINVTQERFYGSASRYKGDFGEDVRLNSSAVHRFTQNSWVEFPNGTVGWVESATQSRLDFIVPAGADEGRLRLHNLVDSQGRDRDNVLTSWSFEGEGTVDDKFEDNDEFPLKDKTRISSVPWVQLLSSDPSKSAPADTNFFWFRISFGTYNFDFTANWQQDANLDMIICRGDGNKPEDYLRDGNGRPICVYGPGDNSGNRSKEEALNVALSSGYWILAYYCVDCPDTPLTYETYFNWRSSESGDLGVLDLGGN
jgi:hypothetical protein